MRRQALSIAALAILLGAVLSGCSLINFTDDQPTNDGGVFKSVDGGEQWQSKVAVPTSSGTPASIITVDVNDLVVDPQDHRTLYLATSANGVFYSYDGGDNWLIPRDQPADMKNTRAVAVDPHDSCTLYAAAGNKILKSENCARSWQEIYFATRPSELLTSLAIDAYEPGVMYAGTSEGTMLKSSDSGRSWKAINKNPAGQSIEEILIDQKDTRRVYFGSLGQGLFKTTDKGKTWTVIAAEQFRDFPGALNFRDLAQDPSVDNTFYLASGYGLLKTTDGGSTWQAVQLTTQPNQAKLYAVAVHPKDAKTIYYSTDTAFYASHDGGTTWIAQKLPTSRAATRLVVDTVEPAILYLGVRQVL